MKFYQDFRKLLDCFVGHLNNRFPTRRGLSRYQRGTTTKWYSEDDQPLLILNKNQPVSQSASESIKSYSFPYFRVFAVESVYLWSFTVINGHL